MSRVRICRREGNWNGERGGCGREPDPYVGGADGFVEAHRDAVPVGERGLPQLQEEGPQPGEMPRSWPGGHSLRPQSVPPSMASMVPLKGITPAATNTVNTQFILLEKGSITQDGKETTCLALVADETASVHFQMWGSECEAFERGDIIRLSSGIFSYHKKNLVLRAGKKGKAEKVGEFTMLFVETPNMSEIRWARDPHNPRKFLQEAVISPHSQIFPPSQ